MYEKNISPINRDKETIIEMKILKFIYNKSTVLEKNDMEVPDHVFLGLILGKIKGPDNNLPDT